MPTKQALTLEQALELVELNQSELARRSGVSKHVISKLVMGSVQAENATHGTIVRLVRALQRAGLPGVTADDVFPVPDLVSASSR